jgi:hypothetical protein
VSGACAYRPACVFDGANAAAGSAEVPQLE